jgi:hypothetical protein
LQGNTGGGGGPASGATLDPPSGTPLAPDWLAPDWLVPDWLVPDWLVPDWLVPDWLVPDWLVPDWDELPVDDPDESPEVDIPLLALRAE